MWEKHPGIDPQMPDNAGVTNDHRALNYLVMRYPGSYARTGGKNLHEIFRRPGWMCFLRD